MANSNVMTGNRVILKINGAAVGFGVQNVDFQDSFGLQDVDGIGQAESFEMVVGKITHTISLSSYNIAGNDLIKQGFVPTADDWMTAGVVDIEVLDKITGQTIELYTGCRADSHSRSYAKHSLSGQNASFRAIHKQTV